MRKKRTEFAVLALTLAGASSVSSGDQIVQSGSLSGFGAPETQPLVLDQFDPMDGLLQLNFVQIDLLTSIIGGYSTDGSGVPVTIFAQLDADYFLDGVLLAETEAVVSTVVTNTNVGSVTVFDTDTEQVLIDQPAELIPWIGQGSVTLDVFTQFQLEEDPAGIIFFGAGGTVQYTVTYDFDVIPAPGALAALLIGGLGCFSPRRDRGRGGWKRAKA